MDVRQWRAAVLALAAAAAVVAGGVATNQVLDEQRLSWNWAYLAFGFMVLASVFSLHAALPGATPEKNARRWGRRWVYLRQVRASVADMETVGLMTQGEFVLRMKQVYVDVTLVPRPPQETGGDAGIGPEPKSAGKRGPLSDFLRRGRVFAVIGSPGSGKTTLVRHMALSLCGGRWRQRQLPVLLYLRDHIEGMLEGKDLADVAVSVPWLRDRAPSDWLGRWLDRGRCLVLLDGLDEVADESDRKHAATWLRAQVARYPRNVFVVTSRPHGYLSNPLPNADVLQVQRFTSKQISLFLHAWSYAMERRAREGTDHHVQQIARKQADDLIKRLRRQPSLYDLAANPLLLTMIANVHRYRGELPGGRAALYSEMCDVLLHRRQEDKNLADSTGLTGPQKSVVVQHLATAMMSARVRDIPTAEAEQTIRTPLAKVRGNKELDPSAFLAEARRCGLLIEREQGMHSFAHLTMQEYLTAARVKEDPGLLTLITDNAGDPWWRETTLLWAANADATPLVERCVEAGTVGTLALAVDCVDEARQIDPAVRDRLESALSDVDPSDESQSAARRRRLLGAVSASRALREVIWPDDTTMMCANPVPESLLLQARTDIRWPDGAASFVVWLNSLFDHGARYRLPTLAEVSRVDRNLFPTGRTFWATDEGGQPHLCHLGGATWPYQPLSKQISAYPNYLIEHIEPLVQLIQAAGSDNEAYQLLVYASLFTRDAPEAPDRDLPLVLELIEALLRTDDLGAGFLAARIGIGPTLNEALDAARILTRERARLRLLAFARDVDVLLSYDLDSPTADHLAHAKDRALDLALDCALESNLRPGIKLGKLLAKNIRTAVRHNAGDAPPELLHSLQARADTLETDIRIAWRLRHRPQRHSLHEILQLTVARRVDIAWEHNLDPDLGSLHAQDRRGDEVASTELPVDVALRRLRELTREREAGSWTPSELAADFGAGVDGRYWAFLRELVAASAVLVGNWERAQRRFYGERHFESWLAGFTQRAVSPPTRATARPAAALANAAKEMVNGRADPQATKLVRRASHLTGLVESGETARNRHVLATAGACLLAALTDLPGEWHAGEAADLIGQALSTLIGLTDAGPEPNQVLMLIRDA